MYITVEKADMVCKFRICMAADLKVASSTNRSPSPAQKEHAQWRSNVYILVHSGGNATLYG